jgi:hypothetical protein
MARTSKPNYTLAPVLHQFRAFPVEGEASKTVKALSDDDL